MHAICLDLVFNGELFPAWDFSVELELDTFEANFLSFELLGSQGHIHGKSPIPLHLQVG